MFRKKKEQSTISTKKYFKHIFVCFLAAAAAVSGQQGHQGQQLVAGQQLNSMIPASQAPTLNMMLQGMNQNMPGHAPHHTLQSPSNSTGHGFLLLQQPGIPGMYIK